MLPLGETDMNPCGVPHLHTLRLGKTSPFEQSLLVTIFLL